MSNLIKMHLKNLFKAPFYIVSISIIIICFGAFNAILMAKGVRFINYIARFDVFSYLEVVIFLILFCMATFFARQKTVLESMCFYTNEQIVLSRMLAGVLSSLVICVIPILYGIICAIQENTDIIFTFTAIIYMVSRWLMIIMVAQCLGYLICCIFKTPAVFLLSIPVAILFSHFNIYFFSFFLHSKNYRQKISNYFSVQKPFVDAMDIDYTGARLDLWFLTKLLCTVFFVALGISIMVAFYNKRKRILLILLAIFMFVGWAGLTYLWSWLYPEKYNGEEKLYILDYENQNYFISSYAGRISLNEWSKFDIDINLSKTGKDYVNELELRLDECFIIKKLSCNDQDVDYKRIGDYIAITLPKDTSSDDVKLHIEYDGRIYYVSDISSINIFSTWLAAALPPNFAFIPLINGDDHEKLYSLEVTGNNNVISNLDINRITPGHYELKGKSSSCCIFMGYFNQNKIGETTFYTAKYNQITDFEEVFNQALELRHIDPARYELSEEEYKKPNKVFMIYYLYDVLGFPVVFDDYMMINYGYTSTV